MPACAEKRGKLWRVVECSNRAILKNNAGTPVDGGGGSKAKIQAQVRAINASLR